jgi:hypothetical protein
MFGLDNEATNHLFLFILLWSLVGGVCVIEARRRGVSTAVAILGSFPLWVAPFAIWLLRQPIIRKD